WAHPFGARHADHLARGDPGRLLHHGFDFRRADEEPAQAQRVADAREEDEAPVGKRVAEIARAVVAVRGERTPGRLLAAVVADHAAGGREELELALRAVLEGLAGLGIAHAHARRGTHRPAATEHPVGNARVLVLAREKRLDLACTVQADEL